MDRQTRLIHLATKYDIGLCVTTGRLAKKTSILARWLRVCQDIICCFIDCSTNCKRKDNIIIINMKLSLCVTVTAMASSASAFSPSFVGTKATALNLFGSGSKPEGDAAGKAGPMAGMKEQMEMFKKAQEIASKKKTIDAEVAKLDITGASENGKVTSTVKIIPGSNPMSPAPDFSVTAINFDDDFFESAAPEDLSTSAVEAVREGEKKAIEEMNAKYASLASDLQGMMAPGGAPAIEEAE